MTDKSCEKCGVKTPKNQMHRLYGEYWLCGNCQKEWNKIFAKMSLVRTDLNGWREWKPVFVQWLKNNMREKVVFT